jgi:hypothetical protein
VDLMLSSFVAIVFYLGAMALYLGELFAFRRHRRRSDKRRS